MNWWNNLVFFFSSLGAFNGLIIGIFFLCFATRKTLSTIFLGLLLIALSIRIGKSVAYFFDYTVPKTLLQAGLTACLFIGPFLYFFITTEMKQVRKMPVSWKRQLIGWSVFILVIGIVLPYYKYPRLWTDAVIPAIYLQWCVYIILAGLAIRPLFNKLRLREKLKPFEKWNLAVWTAVSIIFLSYAWAFTGLTQGSYLTGAINFSLVTYLTIFILLARRKANDLSTFNQPKYGDKSRDTVISETLVSRLKQVMSEQQLYKNKTLKIGDLAMAVDRPAHEVSRLLNESLQKNFTLFVNEYRVHAACDMLLDHPHLTIEAIGDEAGFNSKSTFFAAFKKIKGLTPNAYLQKMTPVS